MKVLLIALFLLVVFSESTLAQTNLIKYKKYLIPTQAAPYQECADGKPRVIVASDINSLDSVDDPDDIQSMVHLFASSDQFITLGLISTPNEGRFESNSKRNIENILDAYSYDFNRSNLSSQYQPPSEFNVRQGLTRNTNVSGLTYSPTSGTHKGAKLILDEAMKVLDGTNCGPVYVLVWGGIPDLALALKESDRMLQAGQIDRGIEDVLRVYFIASGNKTSGLQGYQYIHDNFLTSGRLWFIQSEHTFRGINGTGGRPTYNEKKTVLNNLTNNQVTVTPNTNSRNSRTRLVGANSYNQSCLSYVLAKSTEDLHSDTLQKSHFVKAGDTPSLLYVMNGDPDDPTSPSWGGQFKLKDPKQSDKWYIDLSIDGSDSAIYNSTLPRSGSDSLTVGRHASAIFGDWEESMSRLASRHDDTCRSRVEPTL